MLYYKAKIKEVIKRNNEKCGEYISIKFTYADQEDKENIAYKNFFIKHPNADLAKKARQMLFRMKSYFSNEPDGEDNGCLMDKDCFITVKQSNNFYNVN